MVYGGGNYASYGMTGVLSKWKRKGIFKALSQACDEWVDDNGISVIVINAAIQNKIIQNAKAKQGFKYVDYTSHRNTNYYSVVMAKWPNGCPYPDWVCQLRFRMAEIRCKLLYAQTGCLYPHTKIMRMFKNMLAR